MIISRLIDPGGGGSSRLGGLVQRGLRIFRQAINGEKRPPGAPEPLALAKLCHPPAVRGHVFSVVRRGAHEILTNYIARNQIQNLAAEMRRRYAFRLMSGPVRFSPGIRNRIALFGFVGLSFASAAGNQAAPEYDHAVRVIKELFDQKPEVQLVLKDCSADIEQGALYVVDQRSISGESDFTVVSDDESDFEVLEPTEDYLIEADNVSFGESDSIICNEVLELRELIELETQQQVELNSIAQNLCKENKMLKEIINAQANEENLLKIEIVSILKVVEEQQKELLMLRELEQRQNSFLKCQSTPATPLYRFKATRKNPRPSWTLRDLDCERGFNDSGSFAIDPEKLRAAGGRVRALKIHRKQRLKNN